MKRVASSLLNAALALTILTGIARAATYSAVDDFSIVGNPNGIWSYLYGGSLLPTPTVGADGLLGVDYWSDSKPVPNSVTIGKNMTSNPVSYLSIVIPKNYLDMDPESIANTDVRLTVPSAGTYSITGSFLGIDTHENSHPVQVTDNGVMIFSGTIASYGQNDSFNLTETLNPGDLIDFKVLTGSTYTYLSTGLQATISPASPATPEPGSILLLSAGLLGVCVVGRRIGGYR